MSWSPAYFAAGEIIQGTISGLFLNLINIGKNEVLTLNLSSHNEDPISYASRFQVNVVNNKITFNRGTALESDVYMGSLLVTKNTDLSSVIRTVWVNTTKPLPIT